MRGVIKANAVERGRDAPPRDSAGHGLDILRLTGEAVLIPVARDAPRAVAAHLASLPSELKKQHGVVAAARSPRP